MAEIKSVNELLNMKLDIPDYQRPYKWDVQNIDDLLSDITNAISDADSVNVVLDPIALNGEHEVLPRYTAE